MRIRKNGKVINLTESDLQRIVKRVLTEGETSCDKTFDEIKTKASPNTSWDLSKKDGKWSLSSGDFCTNDIVVYGASVSLKNGITTSVVNVDNKKNRIFFDGFNVGSIADRQKKQKENEGLEEEKMVGCPSVANLKFFQNIFKEYPTSRYKEIKLDEDYNILSITLSSKGTADTLLKMYKCQSPIKFDTTQDLKSTLPSLEGYTDKLYIVGLKNNSLSIRGGFYLNNQKPFTINLK